MKEKKSRVGSFLCFRAPIPDDDEMNEKKAKDPPDADGSRKKRSSRLMSKILKAISFKSNSSNRGEKLPKDQTRSRLGEAPESSENQSPAFKSSGKISDASSSSCSLFSSSSCRCSAAPSTTTAAAPTMRVRRKMTFMPPPPTRNPGYATGLTLVLLSLFAIVFCGRLCAILWTATWLCLAPRRPRLPPEFSDAASVAAAPAPSSSTKSRRRAEYSEEEKKRVVMEGFLQRNRKLV